MIKLVSVVVPLYNEVGNLPVLVAEIAAAMADTGYAYEMVLVNDGSSDGTWQQLQTLAAEHPQLRGIDLAGNYGQTLALRAGFDAARGDVIVAMDGDLQHDPAYIPQFLEYLEQGYDMVGGYKEESPDSWFKRRAAKAAHRLIARISGFDMRYFGATFKAYRSYLLDNVNLLSDSHRFLGAVVAREGIRFKEIPITIRERGEGASSYTLSKSFRVIVDLLFLKFAISYMHKPFRLFGVTGGVLFLIGLASTFGFAVGSVFFGVHVKGEYMAEFMLAVSTMVIGLLFISFGLVAEIGIHSYYGRAGACPYRIRQQAGQEAPP